MQLCKRLPPWLPKRTGMPRSSDILARVTRLITAALIKVGNQLSWVKVAVYGKIDWGYEKGVIIVKPNIFSAVTDGNPWLSKQNND